MINASINTPDFFWGKKTGFIKFLIWSDLISYLDINLSSINWRRIFVLNVLPDIPCRLKRGRIRLCHEILFRRCLLPNIYFLTIRAPSIFSDLYHAEIHLPLKFVLSLYKDAISSRMVPKKIKKIPKYKMKFPVSGFPAIRQMGKRTLPCFFVSWKKRKASTMGRDLPPVFLCGFYLRWFALRPIDSSPKMLKDSEAPLKSAEKSFLSGVSGWANQFALPTLLFAHFFGSVL